MFITQTVHLSEKNRSRRATTSRADRMVARTGSVFRLDCIGESIETSLIPTSPDRDRFGGVKQFSGFTR